MKLGPDNPDSLTQLLKFQIGYGATITNNKW